MATLKHVRLFPNSLRAGKVPISKTICSSPTGGARELGLKRGEPLERWPPGWFKFLSTCPINQEISSSITDCFILGIFLSKAGSILRRPCGIGTLQALPLPRYWDCGVPEKRSSPSLSSPHSPAGLHHQLTLWLLQRPSTAEKQLHCSVRGNSEGKKVGSERLFFF